MISFIHTADVHFGVENYGRIDPKTGIHTRLLDFQRALSSAIDVAIERNVDFFLFSGDAYKTAHPTPTQQRLLFECFLRLFKAEIPIILIVGNHDNPLSFGKAHALELYGQLPLDGFHVIAKPSLIHLTTKHGPVNVVGIPWPSRNTIALQGAHLHGTGPDVAHYISKAVSVIIEEYAQSLDPSIPAVLASHVTVSSGIFSGSEKRAIYGTDPVLMPSQLSLPPFDYVALGHLHRHQNLNLHGSIPVVYSGSIERVDFGERKEAKGFCYVTIPDKQKATYEFIETPTRPFIQIETELSGTEHHTDQLVEQLKRQELEGSVVKIVYHVPKGVRDKVNISMLQQLCAQLSVHHLVGVFPQRVPEIRQRRAPLTVSMDLSELLDAYLTTKPEWKSRREELHKKIKKLEEELSSTD